jgi:hypothetical protein
VPTGSSTAGSRVHFWGRGEEGLTGAISPQRRGSSGGRRRREWHPMIDGGGSSAGEGRGIGGDLVVVPVRLDGGRSGSLPTASLPQLDWVPTGSPSGRQLTLLTEEEVAGAARWPHDETLRRGGAVRGSASGKSRSGSRRRPSLRPWVRCRE